METDEDRVDAAVLAPLYLTLDRDGRAWKGFDWSVMNRLHGDDPQSDRQSQIGPHRRRHR